MRIPRHWRLNSQRYALQGVTCPHCAANIFPPREVCPYCDSRTDEHSTVPVEEPAQQHAAVLEPAAR